MKIGLYGYENAGATTLFNAITGFDVPTGFSGDRQQTHLGTVKVPDPRIDVLTRLYSPKKTIYAELVFSDFPAASRERKALSNVQEAKTMDMLVLLVGAFSSDGSTPDPAGELESLLTEMVIVDLEHVIKYLEKQRKVPAAAKDTRLVALVERLLPHLEAGLPLRTFGLTPEEENALRGFAFLTQKPALAAINVDEARLGEKPDEALEKLAEHHQVRPFLLSARVEEEISRLAPEDQELFLTDLGLSEKLSGRLLRAAYDLANLMSFFTVGPDEVRAWTIRKNTPAKQAAGTIHSDLEKGFIRAEVFTYDDIVEVNGNEAELKKRGKLRLEGKEYIVRDGDILHVRFNV